MKQTVCAVIVTYNRKNYLLKLLKGLKQQTKCIDAILIFDNFSSDGTNKALVENSFTDDISLNTLHNKINSDYMSYYYRNSNNSGGSGGFHDAIKIASKLGYDYLWCMDDDVYPETNCLEELVKNISEFNQICIPTRTDAHYKDYGVTAFNMSNPFKYNIVSRKTIYTNEQILSDTVKVVDMPFEGPLISNCLIKKIGLPIRNFFIIFDDTEYATRANKETDIIYCKKAILHKQIIPNIKNKQKFMDWKNYYGYRNQIWFDRHYAKNCFVKVLRPRLLFIDLCLRAILQRKWVNLNIIKAAYQDGMTDQLGKIVEPGTKADNFTRITK